MRHLDIMWFLPFGQKYFLRKPHKMEYISLAFSFTYFAVQQLSDGPHRPGVFDFHPSYNSEYPDGRRSLMVDV